MQQRSDNIASRSQLLDLVETLGLYAHIEELESTKKSRENAQSIFERLGQRTYVRPTSVVGVRSQ
ncbi:hypothetical protein KC921_02840 [Candidatus Woesebacteria bacterium]|nr:hypothetical protein [Candidatus Woesebacteria bacterium]